MRSNPLALASAWSASRPARRGHRIDASNVKRLGLVWSYEVGDGGGDQEATPLEWNNTIFGITNWSLVFAVDARTGKQKTLVRTVGLEPTRPFRASGF